MLFRVSCCHSHGTCARIKAEAAPLLPRTRPTVKGGAAGPTSEPGKGEAQLACACLPSPVLRVSRCGFYVALYWDLEIPECTCCPRPGTAGTHVSSAEMSFLPLVRCGPALSGRLSSGAAFLPSPAHLLTPWLRHVPHRMVTTAWHRLPPSPDDRPGFGAGPATPETQLLFCSVRPSLADHLNRGHERGVRRLGKLRSDCGLRHADACNLGPAGQIPSSVLYYNEARRRGGLLRQSWSSGEVEEPQTPRARRLLKHSASLATSLKWE